METHSKTILVTGGTGFVGRSLCRALAELGAKVVVLARKQPPPDKDISFIRSVLEITGQNIDVIINLAGEPIVQRWTGAAKNKIWRSRIDTTSMLVNFIKDAMEKPALFVSASAIGYYGTDRHAEFNEMSSPASSAPFSRDLCAAWESEASKAQQYGVRTVFLRMGVVIGKDGGMLARLLLPFQLGLGGPIGRGDQWLSWIDRDDLVSLIVHILNTPSLEGPINATSPNPVTNLAFAEALANTLKKPCLLRIPAFALRAVFGDMADEIMLEGQKVLPTKALGSGFVFSYPDLNASLQKILKGEDAQE